MRLGLSSLLFVLLSTISSLANADFASDLAQKFPAVAGAKIEPAFPGFYSVVKGEEILFVREDLSVLITGDVIDLKTNRSMTAQLRAANPRKVRVSDLRLEDSIPFGKGTRTLYVLADPDCGYCKQLQRELAKLENVKVHLFPFPLTALHPNAGSVSESIWCQADRAGAWTNYVLNGKQPPSKTCANPLGRNMKFAESYAIRGTPTLIFADGSVIQGALTADRIESFLNGTSGR